MKLISRPSLNASREEINRRMKLRRVTAAVVLAIYGVSVCGWFVSPAFAEDEAAAGAVEVAERTVQEADPYEGEQVTSPPAEPTPLLMQGGQATWRSWRWELMP